MTLREKIGMRLVSFIKYEEDRRPVWCTRNQILYRLIKLFTGQYPFYFVEDHVDELIAKGWI